MIFLIFGIFFLFQSCEKELFTLSDPITDIDGNTYNTISIGSQIWMKENLKTVHYNNGDPISLVTDLEEWALTETGSYCDYNNSLSDGNIYGHLYNYYAVKDDRNICPSGWHVPSDNEWNTLVDYLGGSEVAGSKMKEKGEKYWTIQNIDATNTSGFSAIPGGGRYPEYYHINEVAYWWTSSAGTISGGWGAIYRAIAYDSKMVYRFDNAALANGYNVRCIKN